MHLALTALYTVGYFILVVKYLDQVFDNLTFLNVVKTSEKFEGEMFLWCDDDLKTSKAF